MQQYQFTVSLSSKPRTCACVLSCNLPPARLEDRPGPLRATAATRWLNGYQNNSQHRKLTVEKFFLPPLLSGLEPATFRSRIRRSAAELSPLPVRVWADSLPPPRHHRETVAGRKEILTLTTKPCGYDLAPRLTVSSSLSRPGPVCAVFHQVCFRVQPPAPRSARSACSALSFGF